MEEHCCKLARKGLTPSQIGVILRDSHGIAQVGSVTGSKVLRILKGKGALPAGPTTLPPALCDTRVASPSMHPHALLRASLPTLPTAPDAPCAEAFEGPFPSLHRAAPVAHPAAVRRYHAAREAVLSYAFPFPPVLRTGLAPDIPEDLYHLIKKAVSVRKHMDRNRKDRDSKFRLILIESRIHRLARYYKTTRKLAPNFKYESATASTLVQG